MSNFDAFNPAKLVVLIEPFIPGAVPHITPIRYQAITPDIFALLFRTTGEEGQEFYFVSLEFDYLPNLAIAEQVISEWTGGEVDRFFAPVGLSERPEPTLEDLRVETGKPYFAVLATVERPEGLGYWSESVVLLPGDSLADKLPQLTEQELGFVRAFIADRTGRDASSVNRNESDYAITVYKNGDHLEFFYK